MDNEESLPNPSPQKVDARPLLKKSRTTISDDSHFPGPLFPAVRRTTTTPPSRRLPSDLRVSVGNDSSPTLGIINRSGGSTGSSSSASFSDRDWMYPSFLGPHTVRNRITVKPAPSSSNSQKLGKASAGGVQRKVAAVVDEKQRIANRPAVVERKTSSEKEVVSSQDLVIRCNSVNQGRAPRVKPSFVFYTLIFTCMFSVSYAIYLRNEVSRLEGENTNLQRVCICKGAVDAISEKVDSLRKGKSEVIEKNHILILGWSDKLGSVLKQLAIANKSVGGGVVVVLAERDKEEMEMDIAKLEFDFMGTSVICRSGSPLILADLKKVSVLKARAIIVLASDENADQLYALFCNQSDARALRVVLSLTGVKEGLKGHVVVEMSDLDNEPLVKLVGGELIETVVAHDVIGRLMIQCALQPGLAQIWEDILGFENAEFYIKRWPQLDGMRFGDALISFPDAIPCGVKVVADKGKIIMNPDDNYLLKEGDEILVIAEDDDTYAPGPLPEVHRGFFPKISNPPKFPEKILFCGWRRDIDDMIMVLEAFLARGSELWMFNEVAEKDREKKLTDGGLDISGLENIKLVHRVGNAVIRRHLENLPLETFDSILILADESLEDSIVHSDSRCLATLLLIRDIQSKRLPDRDKKSTSLRLSGFSHSSWIREMQQASDKSIIISEILDSRTRNLVSVSRISDYVLSNELVSMALAMVAEDKQINRVLEELFAEEGNEMCIKPAEFYLFDQEEVCFYDIMVRGRQRNEVVIGYRLASADHAIINPPQKLEPRKWSLDDVFVVISLGE
ncbi:ion channel POLLUX-like isoform X3 [Tripterygium wilfordii]|uniref:ion channel POLLUX-like isoform X3 n=1 Tax=Tripterygium wilfordii TaxID=458696 RepID=UPI0018F7F431|nr:ion channel POLLUX-like isoform X3 [Tripterygium wilfordii]